MAHSQDTVSPSVKMDDNDPSPDFVRMAFIIDPIRVAKKTSCCVAKAVIANGKVQCDIQARSVLCNAEVKDASGHVTKYVAKYRLPFDVVPVESNYKTKNGQVLVYLKKKEVQSWVPHFSRVEEVSVDANDLAK